MKTKTLSMVLAAAVLALTAIGCASHEKTTSAYGNTSTTVTSK